MKKLVLTCLLLLLLVDVFAQVQAKVSAFLQYHPTDSQTLKHRSREALVKMNINTGEVKLTVPLQSFAEKDVALTNALPEAPVKMELYFTVDGDPFLLHSSRKESVVDVPGMLHINNHYHHVKVRFSVSKNAEQPTTQNLTYLISISYSFLPKHYELEKLGQLTTQPIKISLYKQPYSFEHNTY